jgi:hypothetical protein
MDYEILNNMPLHQEPDNLQLPVAKFRIQKKVDRWRKIPLEMASSSGFQSASRDQKTLFLTGFRHRLMYFLILILDKKPD